MTRSEAIEGWKVIARAVFTAENAIVDQWRDRLKEAAANGGAEADRTLDLYLTAVAEEVLKHTNDEELKRFEL